ncbi:hypothetical protein [Clostridium algidicarnis]|uniref:hypothetical protein n=1 Tax=Clostridium algidicarnis TaxID=37659 RepID=UPI001623EC35|nr:hypothetical protein [Clostridium algidicarnis]MBB6631648.1 hypothetical protein [Clostridium algidicarnis]
MSKINSLRFINLNYNNNSMKIDDETFYLGGKNTLLNLRNGGGKSVLVQMVMAPFMGKRKRNMKDRTFDSYFTTSSPTYILVEWLLEDNAGYLLTGMMVRKRQLASDDDSKDKLEILSFVHEYKEKNKYDIKSFPFIEEEGNVRKLRGFISSKNIFEDLKKDSNYKFNYYDMNTQATRYFDKLREYKIDNKEWENIIRKVNLKESGLSELFNTAKNESGLVKEWFIPAIEDKLNKDEDRIKKYNELMDSYIKQYKNNKSKIDSKNNMELFMELSAQIDENAKNYKETIEIKNHIENNIANLMNKIDEEYKTKEESISEIESKEDVLKEKLNAINYEEISSYIYKKEDEKQEENRGLKEQTERLVLEEENLTFLKRRKNILECAKNYFDYTKASEETQMIENELEALNKSNEEKLPRIKDLGYSIKEILDKEKNVQKSSLIKYEQEKEELISDEAKSNRIKNDLIIESSDLNAKVAVLKERIEKYNKEEEKFNKEYSLDINRNIEGYYKEDGLISFEKQIEKAIEETNNVLKNLTKSYKENEEKIKIANKEKEDNLLGEKANYINLENSKELLMEIETKINERKQIIKIIDFSENKLFNIEEILEAFQRNIKELKIDERKNSKKLEELNKELEKLESGKVLEVPIEIEGALYRKGINILYGMQWLKNNGYSEKKNKQLVEKNSFIPYSLIMDEGDIETLRNESLDIFTNFPIPIIKRQDIEKEIETNNGVIDIKGVSFYIAFNEALLDEVELKHLIGDINLKKEKISKTIENIEAEIELYSRKRNEVQYSNLSEEEYKKLKDKINILQEENKNMLVKIRELQQDLIKLNQENDNLDKEISHYKNKSEESKRKLQSFIELRSEYNQYKENKAKLAKNIGLLKENKFSISEIEKEISIIKNNLEVKKDVISSTGQLLKDIKKEELEYSDYEEGTKIIKDKEDLVSEYKALTKNISESEKSLKERLKAVRERYNETENHLIEKARYYELQEVDYINETYNLSKEKEVNSNIGVKEKEIKRLGKIIKEIEKTIAVLDSQIESLYKRLRTTLNKEVALAREEVFHRDFELEKAKIDSQKQELKDLKNIELKDKRTLENNKSSLVSYSNLEVKEVLEIIINYDTLDEDRGRLERDLRNIDKDIVKNENILYRTIVNIQNQEVFKDTLEFNTPLNTMGELVKRPLEVLEYLTMLIESFNIQLQKLNTDIELIGEEEDNLITSMLEYIKDIHENIGMIDENSSIIIDNKRRKMLDIILDNFEENKELYKIKLKDYVETIRDNGIKILEENKNIEEYINSTITTIKLYDEVINIDSIVIKLYKVEENKQIKITWREVAKNSGGEGFLSAFVILSSLLSYTRKDESDIFSKNEGGKVLIMDNPFAQTNAVHLLKPLMDIAKKSNTQLICLSGLGGDSIYGRFENIYVLNLIKSSLNTNKSYLKGEHKKGEEESEKESLIAARFDIEPSDQMRLF